MFKQILVTLDGSKLAELALPYAEDLVETFNSDMTLLFICDTPHCKERYEHQVYMENIAGLVAEQVRVKHPEVSVKQVVLEGHAAVEIVNYSNQNDVSLIAMATHGRSGIVAWALGSVAHKILHAVDIPVLLVRAGAHIQEVSRGGQLFEHILVPLDGSEAGESALPYVMDLANKLSSEVILCQVAAQGRHVHTIGGLDYVRFNGHEVDAAREKSAYLTGVAARMEATKASMRSEMRVGDPAEEIIKLADEIGTCLVAMSTHGHSGIERWAFGSITDKIIHAGKTPVLVVNAQHTE